MGLFRRLSHWHFSTLPLSGLSDVGANFIPYLMGQWRASKKILSATTAGAFPDINPYYTFLHKLYCSLKLAPFCLA